MPLVPAMSGFCVDSKYGHKRITQNEHLLGILHADLETATKTGEHALQLLREAAELFGNSLILENRDDPSLYNGLRAQAEVVLVMSRNVENIYWKMIEAISVVREERREQTQPQHPFGEVVR